MKERRQSQRFPLELHADCFGKSGAAGMHVMVTDISQEGVAIKLYADAEPAIDSEVSLELDIPGKLDPIRVDLRITWKKSVAAECLFDSAVASLVMCFVP